MKRTFVAIKINISKQFDEVINQIKLLLKQEKIRWVEAGNIHITLFFLGDTNEDIIEKISENLLRELENINSFSLSCRGIGVFKNSHDPKVIWAGIENSDELIKLKKRIDQMLIPFGFKLEEKLFKPHLTLGRLKYIKV